MMLRGEAKMIGRFSRAVAVVMLAMMGTSAMAQEKSAQVADAAVAQHRIEAGDLLDIAVFETPELSGRIRVTNAGTLSLPLVGIVPVSGMTSREVEVDLRDRLIKGGYVLDPQVTVNVVEFTLEGITVLGEVKKSITVPAVGTRRLLDVLSAAEGLNPTAANIAYIAHRDSSDKPEIVDLAWDHPERVQSNPILRAGDVVTIPRAGIVYVIGDVNRPGGFVLGERQTLSLIKALALAEGPKSTAAMSKVHIIRKTPEGMQDIRVNLARVLDTRDSDVTLLKEDIVVVPPSIGKRALYRGLEVSTAVASALIYKF